MLSKHSHSKKFLFFSIPNTQNLLKFLVKIFFFLICLFEPHCYKLFHDMHREVHSIIRQKTSVFSKVEKWDCSLIVLVSSQRNIAPWITKPHMSDFYCIILKKNWKQLPLCKCCNCSFKHIGIGFIWLVRQEFRQGKSWKAICTSQIFDMLGAKEMRKRQ